MKKPVYSARRNSGFSYTASVQQDVEGGDKGITVDGDTKGQNYLETEGELSTSVALKLQKGKKCMVITWAKNGVKATSCTIFAYIEQEQIDLERLGKQKTTYGIYEKTAM